MLIHSVGLDSKDEILNYCRKSGIYRGGLRDINPRAARALAGIQINRVVTNKRYKSIRARWRAASIAAVPRSFHFISKVERICIGKFMAKVKTKLVMTSAEAELYL